MRRFKVTFSWTTTIDFGVIEAENGFTAEMMASNRLVAKKLEEVVSGGQWKVEEIRPEEER